MIYREHFLERQYLQHGVALPEGGTVVDVGAHVGVFACFAAEAVGPRGRVVALEPSPSTHACCAANAAGHAAWAAARGGGGGAAPISVVAAACGDGSASEMMLTVFDRAQLMNTLCASDRQEEMLVAYARAKLEEGRPAGSLPERMLVRAAAGRGECSCALPCPCCPTSGGFWIRPGCPGRAALSHVTHTTTTTTQRKPPSKHRSAPRTARSRCRASATCC